MSVQPAAPPPPSSPLSIILSSYGLDFAYWIYQHWPFGGSDVKSNRRSFEVEGPEIQGEGKPRRAIGFKDLITVPAPDVKTLFDLLQYAERKYSTNHCAGYRTLVKVHSEEKEIVKVEGGVEKKEKKTWQYFEMSDYKWLSYKEFSTIAKNFGRGLISKEVGMEKEKMLGIYSNTQYEWLAAAHGSWSQSIAVVTAYANLGEDGISFALNQGELEHIFTNHDLLPIILRIKPKCPKLKVIIYTGTAKEGILNSLKELGLAVFNFEEVVQLGASSSNETHPPSPADLAMIMYTSGTTDLPKGVMMSHQNLIASVAGGINCVEIREDDVYIAYLPLAHVLELVVEHVILINGASLGYASNKTLTDASVKNCKGDLNALQPTLMAGVPVVWERIRKGALSKVEHTGGFTKSLFEFAYKVKLDAVRRNKSSPLLDSIVFKNFKRQTGGKLRIMLSGGAPISAETHEFLRVAFSCPVTVGYGLTEICGIGTLLPLDHLATDRAGAPSPSLEIKLVDVPEMGYTSKDKPHPRGEIWFRGGNVTLGYYKNEAKTKEDFKDGWFASGDIGEWHEDGTLSVIDRKKNLIKLSHGEYIAVEKLESKYHNSPFVENICVYADGFRDYPVAIVKIAEGSTLKWARDAGINDDFHTIASRKDFKAAVLQNLQSIAKSTGLKEIETVKGVVLTTDEWTPENEMLTAAMKLKRQSIIPKYKQEIEALYTPAN